MASPFDLAQLVDLKTWLDIQSDDDDVLLGRLITQTSRAILSLLDRPCILPAAHEETIDGRGETAILLRQWPALSVESCAIDGVKIAPAMPFGSGRGASSGFMLEPPQVAPPGRMQKLALRGSCFRHGIQNVSVTYRAGYQIDGERALVPFAPPYEIAAEAPYGDWAGDGGVAYVNGEPLTPVAASPAAGQYSVANGLYSFSSADAGGAIALTYGYIPADLGFCCLDWAAELYNYRARIGQQSKSLGGQETSSFIVKDVPDFVAAAVQPFKRVVMP